MMMMMMLTATDWLFVNHTASEYLWGYTDPFLGDLDDILHTVFNVSNPESIIPAFIQLQSNETGISFLNSTVYSGSVCVLLWLVVPDDAG